MSELCFTNKMCLALLNSIELCFTSWSLSPASASKTNMFPDSCVLSSQPVSVSPLRLTSDQKISVCEEEEEDGAEPPGSRCRSVRSDRSKLGLEPQTQ